MHLVTVEADSALALFCRSQGSSAPAVSVGAQLSTSGNALRGHWSSL